MEYLSETLNTPVRDETDVLVVGGGIAGVAAAVAARRLVLLIHAVSTDDHLKCLM